MGGGKRRGAAMLMVGGALAAAMSGAATTTSAGTAQLTAAGSRGATGPLPSASALALSGWPTTAASILIGDSLASRVTVRRGVAKVELQRRSSGGWATTQAFAVSRRTARVVISGTEAGRWRYRLRGSTGTRLLHTPARTVRVVDPGSGAAWQSEHFAVGDIGDCAGRPGATAALLPDGASLLALGDIAYPQGRIKDFRRCYMPHYRRLLESTRPVPGNHEYLSGALGYFEVFGRRAGTPRRPWYAWEDGPWRFLMLNSNCSSNGGCGRGSRQLAWVERQLRDHPRTCLAAAWHAPVYSSGKHGNDPAMRAILRRLVRAGADIVLNGHDHSYERFARMGVDGPDPDGVRQFVVGTGGADLYEFTGVERGSEFRYNSGHGTLRLVLADASFRWEFLAVGGGDVDTGTDTCS